MKQLFIRIANIVVIFLLASLPLSAGVRFAVVGDTQAGFLDITPVNDEVFSRIIQLVLESDPPVQFAVQCGDLINGTFEKEKQIEELEYWRSVAQPWYDSNFLDLKVYPTPGNHDQLNPSFSLETWQTVFPELPNNGPDDAKKMTYSFDIGSCHFIVVNTSSQKIMLEHTVDTDWLAEDLASSTQPVIFVFGHEPAYPVGRHLSSSLDARPEKRDLFWQLLSDYGVKAYFCGHEHVYDHWIKDGVHQIITGSGGAESDLYDYLIVDVDDNNNVTVSVYNIDGNTLIDQFDLADTKDVPSDDRTSEDNFFYDIIDSLSCSSSLIYLIIPLFSAFNSITIRMGNKHE
jgi:hypothetical protein